MAGVTFTIDIKDEGVKQMLAAISSRLGNLAPAMKLIGEIVTESVQRNFMQHRSPEGAPWKPLSPAYAAWKGGAKGRSADDILILNRILLGSIHPTPAANKVTISTGSNIVYAAIHQFGGPIKRRSGLPVQKVARSGREHFARRAANRTFTMPARPYLGVRDEDWTEIKDALTNYLLRI
jgi:phage gpG-like protein